MHFLSTLIVLWGPLLQLQVGRRSFIWEQKFGSLVGHERWHITPPVLSHQTRCLYSTPLTCLRDTTKYLLLHICMFLSYEMLPSPKLDHNQGKISPKFLWKESKIFFSAVLFHSLFLYSCNYNSLMFFHWITVNTYTLYNSQAHSIRKWHIKTELKNKWDHLLQYYLRKPKNDDACIFGTEEQQKCWVIACIFHATIGLSSMRKLL